MQRNRRSPECYDTRKCFGAMRQGNDRLCRILESTYHDNGECPFCKEDEMDFPNAKYHNLIMDSGFQYKKVAMCMGVSPNYLTDIMSKPLSESNIIRIKKAVKELKRERSKNV